MLKAFSQTIKNTLQFARKVYHDANEALAVQKSARFAGVVAASQMAAFAMRVGTDKGVINTQQNSQQMTIVLPTDSTHEGRNELRQLNQFIREKTKELDQKTDNIFMSLFGIRLADSLTHADWFKMYCEEKGYLLDKQSKVGYTNAGLIAQSKLDSPLELPHYPEWGYA